MFAMSALVGTRVVATPVVARRERVNTRTSAMAKPAKKGAKKVSDRPGQKKRWGSAGQPCSEWIWCNLWVDSLAAAPAGEV